MIYRAADDSVEFESDDELKPNLRRISIEHEDGSETAVGLYENTTGNIYSLPGEDLAVRILGELSESSGQVTILQPNGTYRRFSRWDRIDVAPPSQPDAILRTLPQCGCGGALGMPRLFDSFEEMSIYFFTTFFLKM